MRQNSKKLRDMKTKSLTIVMLALLAVIMSAVSAKARPLTVEEVVTEESGPALIGWGEAE